MPLDADADPATPCKRVAGYYDGLAAGYDATYSDRRAEIENRAVRLVLAISGILWRGDVLDLGCGTGLLLDLAPWLPRKRYLGLDVSPGMIAEAARKHPWRDFAVGDMAHPPTRIGRFAVAVSLFGAVSYVRPPSLAAALCGVLGRHGEAFLMALAPGYVPAGHPPELTACLRDWSPAAVVPALRAVGFRDIRARGFSWPVEDERRPLPWLSVKQARKTIRHDASQLGAEGGHRYLIFTGRLSA